MDPSILKIQDGTILDKRFEILGVLGRGGFATVYRARLLDDGSHVALKILGIRPGKDDAEIEHFSQRFFMEARSASSIKHPGIVSILDHGVTSGGIPYIAMELLQGQTLEEDLARSGAMDPRRALPLFIGGLDALNAAHQAGIVHKDIKPSNLFVVYPHTPNEHMALLDFGVAAMTDADRGERLTATDQFIGTAPYCSPEYYEQKLVSPAVDVYQMGLVLAETLMGRRVVHTTNPLQAIMAHCTGALKLPWALLQGPLGPVLRNALAKDPQDRFADASRMRDALSAIDPDDVRPLSDDDLHRNVLIFPPNSKGASSIEFSTAEDAFQNFGVGTADTLATFSSTQSSSPSNNTHSIDDTYPGPASENTVDLPTPPTSKKLNPPTPAQPPSSGIKAPHRDEPTSAPSTHETSAAPVYPPPERATPRSPLLLGGALLITVLSVGGLYAALGSPSKEPTKQATTKAPSATTTDLKAEPWRLVGQPGVTEPKATDSTPNNPTARSTPDTSTSGSPTVTRTAPTEAAPPTEANLQVTELNLLVEPPRATLEALRKGSPSRRISNGFTTLRAMSEKSPLPWELSVSSPQHKTSNIRLEKSSQGALLVRFDEDDSESVSWGDPSELKADELGRYTLKLKLDRSTRPGAGRGNRKPFKKDWIVQ